jgi:hypothetical protein
MNAHGETTHSDHPETFNPWSIVNLVFNHLAEEGLHPVLGESGDPGKPAAELLRALGITPAAEGNRMESEQRKQRLAEIRAAFDQGLFPSQKPKNCLMLRAHDLGFRDVMQHTRTFGAVGCSPWGPHRASCPRNPPRKG